MWTEWISIGCILICAVICLTVLLFSISAEGRNGSITYRLNSAKEQKSITAEYLLSYILPLFAFDFTHWDQVILFLIFFGILGFLCIRHNYFSVNIILEVANFRFYECSLKNDDGIEIETLILSNRKLNSMYGKRLSLKPINNEIKLDVG